MAEDHQSPPASATPPSSEQVSSSINNVDAICYVESIADVGIKAAMSNIGHQYNEVVEESSRLEYSIRHLKVTAGNFTRLAALMAFFAIVQLNLLYSIQTVDPTNISSAFLDTFFSLATIAILFDCFSALRAIQYMYRTLRVVNRAHRLLGDKRRASELISHVVNAAKKGYHLSGSYKVALDTLNASCKSISNDLRRLQRIIDNHTYGLYWIVTVTGSYFGIVLLFVSTVMAVCITYLKEV